MDLYLYKLERLSTTEALGKRLPMVLVDAVGGCEELNLNYFISIGSAMTAKSPKELTELCVSLLKQPQKLMEMEEALNQHAHDYAAEKIYSKIISD